MRDLAAGDRRALEILYERHAELVFRTAYRFLLDEEEARDITQSVFVTLMRSAPGYRPEARLTTWIHRIVVNRCLNHSSRAELRLRGSLDEQDLEQVPAPEQEQPDRLLDRARERKLVQAALLELPERQRMALLLKRFEGLSYEEIGRSLGCSQSTVESLLFRARRSLKRLLRPRSGAE